MVDLHLHTNASDGRCTPSELLSRAVEARLSVISITDHDTFAGTLEAISHAAAAGLRLIPGIEITAVWQQVDVHVLGYYLDPADPDLSTLLEHQRRDRLRRVREMVARLTALGAPIDYEQVVVPVEGRIPHAIGRPQVARALVRAGHAIDLDDAFDRFVGEGRPAFVPRAAASPAEIAAVIVRAGGIASLAHPGLLGHDEIVPGMIDAGMQAIEVYHPDHSPEDVAHYLRLAERLGLAATGGSDYHAEVTHGSPLPGSVTLPAQDLARLDALASHHS